MLARGEARTASHAIQPSALWMLVVLACAVSIVLGLEFLRSDGSSTSAAVAVSPPSVVEQLAGQDVSRVRLSQAAADRIGLRTAPVQRASEGGSLTTVPYSALIYEDDGTTWVYVRRGKLAFVRAAVAVVHIKGQVALLSRGLSAGLRVVAVGAPELFGSEFEVGH